MIQLEDSLNRIVSSCDEKDEDNFYKGHYLPIALQTGHYGKAYKTACDVLQSDSENIKALEAVCFVFGKDAAVHDILCDGLPLDINVMLKCKHPTLLKYPI